MDKKTIYFILILVSISALYYHHLITSPPGNMHVFRQSDCLSMTQKYYEGASFFEPQLHAQFADDKTSGKTAGEFPILYYTVGNIWKIFGKSYFSYRLIWMLIMFAGLIALFKTVQLFFENTILPFLIPLLLFTSPTFVYYNVSFLTDGPAFSITLIAIYFFSSYIVLNKKNNLWFSILFFSLGGLLKVSSLIPYCVLLGLFSFSLLPPKKITFFKHKLKEGIALLSVIAIIISWVVYVKYYNGIHGFKYTFNDTFPFWNEHANLNGFLKGFINHMGPLFFSRMILYALFFTGILNFFILKKIPFSLSVIYILTLLGAISYFVLWGPLFANHDYYYTPLLNIFIAVIIPFAFYIKYNFKHLLKATLTRVFIISFLCFNIIYCFSVIQLKSNNNVGDFFKSFVGNHDFIVLLKWMNEDVNAKYWAFDRARPYLKEIGVSDTSKVISLPDDSFSISLFFMQKDGWTNYVKYNKSEEIDVLKQKGAEFLIINNEETLKESYLQPFLNNKIGVFENIHIYKL